MQQIDYIWDLLIKYIMWGNTWRHCMILLNNNASESYNPHKVLITQ